MDNINIVYKKPTEYDLKSSTSINLNYSDEIHNSQNEPNLNNIFILFIDYLKLNNLSIIELENSKIFEYIIKKFILDKKLNQKQTIDFLSDIKNKFSEENFKQNLNNNHDSKNNINNIIIKENFQNFTEQEKYDNLIYEQLINNDINTWILSGIILLSIVILIMMIIYN